MDIHTGILWLALNTYFEARGEPYEGKKMVAHVVLNRVRDRERSIQDVITESKQFSWYNGGVIPPVLEPNAFFECYSSAMDVLMNERFQGMSGHEVDHYHAVSVDPYWAEDMQLVTTIGKHKFYRGK
jgi:spore germination cell wall hydrolase CwlJ-like protein